MNIANIIDWILRITGILTLIKIICNFIFNKKQWNDYVKIKRVYDYEKYLDDYKHVYSYGEDLEETTIVEGNVFPIKKINIYDTKYENKKLKKSKLIYSHKNLLPGEALFLNRYYSCGIPNCIIEIVTYDYGKASIVLSENGVNGNVNYENGIQYKYNFFSKIYSLIFN